MRTMNSKERWKKGKEASKELEKAPASNEGVVPQDTIYRRAVENADLKPGDVVIHSKLAAAKFLREISVWKVDMLI